MNIEQIKETYPEFKEKNLGFGELVIIEESGAIKYCTSDSYITTEEAKNLVNAWINHESAIIIGENRFPILSHEDYQFAARNVKGKGALVGSKMKSGEFVIAHLLPVSPLSPTIAAININRWVWGI